MSIPGGFLKEASISDETLARSWAGRMAAHLSHALARERSGTCHGLDHVTNDDQWAHVMTWVM